MDPSTTPAEEIEIPRHTFIHRFGLVLTALGILGILGIAIFALVDIGGVVIEDFRASELGGVLTLVVMVVVGALILIPASLIAAGAGVLSFGVPWLGLILIVSSVVTLIFVQEDGLLHSVLIFTALLTTPSCAVGIGFRAQESAPMSKGHIRERKFLAEEREAYGPQFDWVNAQGLRKKKYKFVADFQRSSVEFQQIGIPGENLHESLDKLDPNAISSGQRGEKVSADKIAELARTDFNGVTLINSVEIPGFDGADADHVLVYGNLVIVIDSKLYGKDAYTWYDRRIVPFPPDPESAQNRRESFMPTAVSEIRSLLPDQVRLHSLVWIHSPNRNDVTIAGNPAPDDLPTLCNGTGGLDFIRTKLENNSPDEYDVTRGPAAVRHQEIVDALLPLVAEYVLKRDVECTPDGAIDQDDVSGDDGGDRNESTTR